MAHRPVLIFLSR